MPATSMPSMTAILLICATLRFASLAVRVTTAIKISMATRKPNPARQFMR